MKLDLKTCQVRTAPRMTALILQLPVLILQLSGDRAAACRADVDDEFGAGAGAGAGAGCRPGKSLATLALMGVE